MLDPLIMPEGCDKWSRDRKNRPMENDSAKICKFHRTIDLTRTLHTLPNLLITLLSRVIPLILPLLTHSCCLLCPPALPICIVHPFYLAPHSLPTHLGLLSSLSWSTPHLPCRTPSGGCDDDHTSQSRVEEVRS